MREQIDYEIVQHIGIIAENQKSNWKKEINIVSWNGKEPKIDIRDWSEDHTRMSRGITLTFEELENAIKHYERYQREKALME